MAENKVYDPDSQLVLTMDMKVDAVPENPCALKKGHCLNCHSHFMAVRPLIKAAVVSRHFIKDLKDEDEMKSIVNDVLDCSNMDFFDTFITNTSDDPVPVDITDSSIDVTLDEPVEVTNPSGEPLEVVITNTPEQQPFGVTEVLDIEDGQTFEWTTPFDVPEGKLLVIEYISAESDSTSGDRIILRLGTPFGVCYIGEFQPPADRGLSKMVKIYAVYAGSGSSVSLGASRYPSETGFLQVDVAMYGYLIDAS